MADMSPIDWALQPLKKYATFSGRAPRAEYWWFYLAYVVLAIALQLLTSISELFGLLGLVYLALVIPFIAVAVRRLHDINRTGWWLLAPALPYAIGLALMLPAIVSGAATPGSLTGMGLASIFLLIGLGLAILVFIFTILPGTRGPNRYGPDPYGADVEQVFA